MRIEIENASNQVCLYEFDGKHFIIENDIIHQIDNELSKSFKINNVWCNYCFEVDDYDIMFRHPGFYFMKKGNYIVYLSKDDGVKVYGFTIFNSNLEILFRGKNIVWLHLLNNDLYFGADSKIYKNMKEFGNDQNRTIDVNYSSVGETKFGTYHKRDTGTDAKLGIRRILPLGRPPNYENKPETICGTIKGYEFIRKHDKLIIQPVDENVSRLEKKIQELKALEAKHQPNNVLEKINEHLKSLDETLLNQFLDAITK
jgi:hypothetical protein